MNRLALPGTKGGPSHGAARAMPPMVLAKDGMEIAQ